MVSSSAVRARTTAERAAREGGWTCEIQLTDRLYLPSAAAVLQEVQAQPESVARLMLVGHEPTWSEVVGRFMGKARVRMVTAAVARLDFAVGDWADVEFGAGSLAWLATPKLLAAARQAAN